MPQKSLICPSLPHSLEEEEEEPFSFPEKVGTPPFPPPPPAVSPPPSFALRHAGLVLVLEKEETSLNPSRLSPLFSFIPGNKLGGGERAFGRTTLVAG